jgi:hypothetical protein
MADVAKKG